MKHRFLTLISSLLLLTACSDSFSGTCSRRKLRRCDILHFRRCTTNKPLHRFTTVHGSTSTPAPSCRWAVTVPTITSVAGELPEFTNFKVTALSENLANAWTGFYSVITMANAVISDVQTKCSNSVSERAKRTAIAEARLMRACAYFYMVRLWGPVIIIEDNDKVVANPMQPLHREEDVLELVIRDLTYRSRESS